jgi:hypothetical protein
MNALDKNMNEQLSISDTNIKQEIKTESKPVIKTTKK